MSQTDAREGHCSKLKRREANLSVRPSRLQRVRGNAEQGFKNDEFAFGDDVIRTREWANAENVSCEVALYLNGAKSGNRHKSDAIEAQW